jgi:hypothetical protein
MKEGLHKGPLSIVRRGCSFALGFMGDGRFTYVAYHPKKTAFSWGPHQRGNSEKSPSLGTIICPKMWKILMYPAPCEKVVSHKRHVTSRNPRFLGGPTREGTRKKRSSLGAVVHCMMWKILLHPAPCEKVVSHKRHATSRNPRFLGGPSNSQAGQTPVWESTPKPPGIPFH